MSYSLALQTLEQGWASITRKYSPEAIELIGTFSVHLILYWVFSLAFLLVDTFGPSSLHKFKLQPALKQPSKKQVRKGLLGSGSNQLLATALHFFQIFALRRMTGQSSAYRIPPSVPTFTEFATAITLCTLARETLYYYGHRMLHLPMFYGRFHKQHHHFTTPIALAGEYSHPIEYLVSNVLPVIIPAGILRVHIVTFWAFLGGATVQGVLSHCGYDFRLICGWTPKVHDFHHELSTVNYGLIGLLDWVHGTRYTGGGKIRPYSIKIKDR